MAVSKILYYLFLKPLSLLPLAVLHCLSDALFLLFWYVVPYRKKVVLQNLRNSFPNKSIKEIETLAKDFYAHLCDIIVESVKLFSISKEELLKRFTFPDPSLVNGFFDQNKSVVMVGAHVNNWEFLAVLCPVIFKHLPLGIYNPLENKFFNQKFMESRSRYGTNLVSTKEVFARMSEPFERPVAVFFGSDQSPTYSKNIIWTTFLNQETAVPTGAEIMAKRYDMPVIFGAIHKIKRGYYYFSTELIAENPTGMPDGEISKAFTKAFEKQIIENPSQWLWTHKRWKRKRKENE